MTFRALLIALALALSGCEKSGEASSSTPIAAPKVLDAEGVAKELAGAGLPVETVGVLTEKTDSNNLLGRPGQYTSKVDFYDHRHPKPADGDAGSATIEVFSSAQDAKKRRDYIAQVTDGVPMLLQYQVLRGSVLLRLDKLLLPSEVKEYEAALDKIV